MVKKLENELKELIKGVELPINHNTDYCTKVYSKYRSYQYAIHGGATKDITWNVENNKQINKDIQPILSYMGLVNYGAPSFYKQEMKDFKAKWNAKYMY